MSETDFASLIEPVARHLWGEPSKSLSTNLQLRWGSNGSKSVKLDGEGFWHDFESGESGGVLKLVMREVACDQAGAIEWLETEGFIQPREDRQEPRSRPDRASAPPEPEQPPAGSADEAKPVPVKGYRYTDGDGNVVYEVIRYHFRNPDGSWALGKLGNPKKTFKQRRPDGRGGYIWGLGDVQHTLYRRQEVERAIEAGKTIFLCYSPDTEVLTPDGWVAFPDLRPGTPVAQYDLADESVSFCVPKAHQRFRYTGEMVNIRAAWCDLLVTPDHRQPRRNLRDGGRIACPPRIAPASTVRYGHQLPSAGVKRDGDAIPLTAARLLVAWLADGVWEPRGSQVSWNLKKGRKQDRLRSALDVLGIRWTEHQYPSTPGWTDFRVAKKDIAEHFPIGPDKRWSWEMLGWSADARGAALDELQHWDGDGASDTSSRFFTGERQSADVVCALAAITGYHANLRVDRREGKNDSYVVNLSHKSWRQLANTPERVPYDGDVFCCTVDTGVLVVRRNGKVTISGNCEGEKDVETIEGWDLAGTTNSGGAQNWRPELAAMLRGADVVILGDDDEAGRKRVDNVARSLIGTASRVRAIYDWGGEKDLTDWKEKGGTKEALIERVASLPDWRPRPPDSKFGAVDLKSIGTGLGRKHTWLVQDMIELGGSCALAGFSQSGKSFLTIKLTFAIVMGEQFFGRDVMQGMVVYQLGEGEAGFEKRIEGFMKDRGIEDISALPLVILPKKINLFASDDDTDALIAEIRAWAEYHQQPCRMVVIDTYNKATRGMNEISGQDNGKVIDRVERISRETGATVVVIDHLSMGGRIRGHGSKTDDMTNTIRVEKDEKKVDNNGRPIRYMHLSKNKDGEAGNKVPFVLRQVVNGFDDKGRPITTCVVDPPDGNQEELERSGRLPLNQATILRVLRDTIDLEGTSPPGGLVVPAGKNVVAWKSFRTMLERKWQYSAPENEPEQRAKELHRVVTDACKKLQLAGYIDKDNPSGLIWWTGKTDRPIPKPRAEPPPLPSDVRDALKDGVPF